MRDGLVLGSEEFAVFHEKFHVSSAQPVETSRLYTACSGSDVARDRSSKLPRALDARLRAKGTSKTRLILTLAKESLFFAVLTIFERVHC
jgi:hypothetical protein